MAEQSEIIEAIEMLDSHGALEKKPNVSEVEALIGSNISASDRDEAWKAYSEKGNKTETENTEIVQITNNYSSALSVFGVTIESGASELVPNFDPKHGVMVKWVKQKVISVK